MLGRKGLKKMSCADLISYKYMCDFIMLMNV